MAAGPVDYVPRTLRCDAGYGCDAGPLVATFFSFWLWRATLLRALAPLFVRPSPEAQFYGRAAYYAIHLALGIAALSFAVGSEAYVRAGVERGRLGAHLARVTIALVAATLLALVVQLTAKGP
jgi:hypothetical protein